MVISYDNLIRRLWLHGAIYPHAADADVGLDGSTNDDVDTMLDEDGKPPIPHEYWVQRLGFQQTDPVTDFRSGGVLSLAMMVHIAESCPVLFKRFVRPDGDASVLPFGITSINITDMMSKFLLLAKTVDRMDALLSQKPFWRMFANPDALTACQEVCLDMLADVVVELQAQRELRGLGNVTVFDFSSILEITEKRVQYDLLGVGPKTVEELYQIHAKVKQKYKIQMVQFQQQYAEQQQQERQPNDAETGDRAGDGADTTTPRNPAATGTAAVEAANSAVDQVFRKASGFAFGATNLAGSVLGKIKSSASIPAGSFNPLASRDSSATDGTGAQAETETVEFEPNQGEATASESEGPGSTTKGADNNTEGQADSHISSRSCAAAKPNSNGEEGDWVGTELQPATDAVRNFTIGGDDEDEEDL